MPYINLQRTNPSNLVNFVTQINNNWDQIDSKFAAVTTFGTNLPGTGVVGPTQGIEASNPNYTPDTTWPCRLAVYDGSAWRQQIPETWGSWTVLTLSAPYVAQSGNVPQVRQSSAGFVEFKGGVQNGAGAAAWPTGVVIINTGQLATATWAPAHTFRKMLGNGTPTTPVGAFSYGVARVQPNVSNFVQIDVQNCSNGGTGGGNLIYLDGISYYRDVIV